MLKFRLPPTLATENRRISGSEHNQVQHLVRRVPIDVKLSLDQRLLVIQFHSTLIRIVPIGRLAEDESFSTTPEKHGTNSFV